MGNNNTSSSSHRNRLEIQPKTTTTMPTTETASEPLISKVTKHKTVYKIRELLECVICLDEFQDPRVLPCHHTFCFKCIEEHCRGSKTFKCPNCNQVVNLKRGVSELPKDFRANSLKECLPKDDESDEEEAAAAAGDDIQPKPPTQAQPARPPTVLKPSDFNAKFVVQEMITCTICNNLLVEPRFLNCDHSFCTRCLEFLTPVEDQVIHCPCCDTMTPVPNGVSSLQLDRFKSNIKLMFTKSDRSDEEAKTASDTVGTSGRLNNQQNTAAVQTQIKTFLMSTCAKVTHFLTPYQALFNSLYERPLVLAVAIGIGTIGTILSLDSVLVILWDVFILNMVLFPALYLQGLQSGVRNRNPSNNIRIQRNIGAIVGAAFIVTYKAFVNTTVFYAVAGAVCGCALLCWHALVSGNRGQVTKREFIESLGPKTVWYIVIGGLYGGILNIFDIVFNTIYGAILGIGLSTYLVGKLKQTRVASNLTRYNIFITCRGVLLGGIISAVLYQIMYPSFGPTSLICGVVNGIGIGLVFGDIYVPMLKNFIGQSPDETIPRTNLGRPRQASLPKRIVLAIGTMAGGVIGYILTMQIFAVLIGAMLGLHLVEQFINSFSAILEKILKSYVHCAVGGLVGGILGVAINLDLYSPVYGPILGLYFEALLFQMYKNVVTLS